VFAVCKALYPDRAALSTPFDFMSASYHLSQDIVGTRLVERLLATSLRQRGNARLGVGITARPG